MDIKLSGVFAFLLLIYASLCSAHVPWLPYMVKDLNPTIGSNSNIENMTRVGDTVYFTAYTGEHGVELWRTDGTESGTYLVKDIYPGKLDSYPHELIEANGLLYFTANDGEHGYELWRSDGTDEGTYMVADSTPGAGSTIISEITNVNGILFYRGGYTQTTDGFPIDVELYRSDGTSQGTYLMDLDPRIINGVHISSGPHRLIAYQDALYFFASNAKYDCALFKTDGTLQGTYRVKYFNVAGAEEYCASTYTAYTDKGTQQLVVGNTLYLVADDGVNGPDLWKTDGTESGTEKVIDISASSDIAHWRYGSTPILLTQMGGVLYFVADTGSDRGSLWRSEGTENGTKVVSNFAGWADELTAVDGMLWFVADDGQHGREPWVSDGTTAGTYMLADLNTTPYDSSTGRTRSSFPFIFNAVAGQVAFATVDPSALWVSDGQPSNTRLLRELNPGSFGSLGQAQSLGSRLVLTGNDYLHGIELWVSDLTQAGTRMLKDINPGAGSHFDIADNVAVGDYFYFVANKNDLQGYLLQNKAIWRTDGTDTGTVMIKDFLYTGPYDEPKGASVANLHAFGNRVVFSVNDDRGISIYVTDGTESGTTPIKAFGVADLDDLSVIGDEIFIEIRQMVRNPDDNSIAIYESIYISDGTELGTVKLTDFRYGNNCSPGTTREGQLTHIYSTPGYVKYGDYIYFNFCDQEHGFELWKTDGTAKGTGMVVDISPGSDYRGWLNHGDPRELTLSGGYLYFRAYTAESGIELWKSDGTAQGTALVKDIWPGNLGLSGSSLHPLLTFPTSLTDYKSKLYFATYDGEPGSTLHTLWATDGTEAGTVNIRSQQVSTLNKLSELLVYKDELYFSASDVDLSDSYGCDRGFRYGNELWKTNGTDSGTIIVKDILNTEADNCWGSYPHGILKVDNYLVFTTHINQPEAFMIELWRSDGTEAGTIPLTNSDPNNHDYMSDPLGNANGTVFFERDDGIHGRELWAMRTYWFIHIDIKPGDDQSCVNPDANGVIPVAIYGDNNVDVREILSDSLVFQGLNVKAVGNSDKYLLEYIDLNSDGYIDVIAHFETGDNWQFPQGQMANLTGQLQDGVAIRGKALLCIVPK